MATVRVQSHGSFPEQDLQCWHPQIRSYQRWRGLPKTLCLPAVVISGQRLGGVVELPPGRRRTETATAIVREAGLPRSMMGFVL